MTAITNDREFRAALDSLDAGQQRAVAASFVKDVLQLCTDQRIARVLEVAVDPGASDAALADALKTAKATTFDCHTRCGSGLFRGTRRCCGTDAPGTDARWRSLAGGHERAHGADIKIDSNR